MESDKILSKILSFSVNIGNGRLHQEEADEVFNLIDEMDKEALESVLMIASLQPLIVDRVNSIVELIPMRDELKEIPWEYYSRCVESKKGLEKMHGDEWEEYIKGLQDRGFEIESVSEDGIYVLGFTKKTNYWERSKGIYLPRVIFSWVSLEDAGKDDQPPSSFSGPTAQC